MTAAADIVTDDYKTKYGFADSTGYLDQSHKGINEDVVKEISRLRNEPIWMEEFRLKALKHQREARPHVGRRPLSDKVPGLLLLRASRQGDGEEVGGRPP